MDPVSFPMHPQPRASVIVLSQRDPAMLARCLRALVASVPPDLAYEVVLLLNAASPDVFGYVRRGVRGATLIVSDVNLGFGGGCNRAARDARGEYLVFLNDDTEVRPRWLEVLVRTADEHPRAGAVGSRLLFPDGSVQEAGSVLFSDGTTAPVGRGLPPDSSAYGFLRRVDYCSAGSLLVRAETFDRVGGFDPRYFPAYYEDADLCLAIRAEGEEVLYDGRSQVLHLESASTRTHFKHFLFARNLTQFRQKWAGLLTGQPPPPPAPPTLDSLRPAVERARGGLPRVLVVDDMLPRPGYGAGFGRMHDLAVETGIGRYLLDTHVTKHPGADPWDVAGIGYQVIDGDLSRHLSDPDVAYDLVVLSRPSNFDSFIGPVRALQPRAALVYAAEALFFRRLEGEAALRQGTDEAGELLAEAATSRVVEERTVRECDRVVCVSEDEAEVLRAVPGACPVDVVQPLAPAIEPTGTPWSQRRDLVFVAGWLPGADSPNGDGLRWFLDEVLPRITSAVPWARLRVTGADPPAEFVARSGPSLSFTGYIDDLAALYAGAQLVVAPMRYGAGVKIKTVEALQYAVPVVTTTIGAEGIPYPCGTPMLVADDPVAFAQAVARLLTDPGEWAARRADIEVLHRHWRSIRPTSWLDVLDSALQSRRDQS